VIEFKMPLGLSDAYVSVSSLLRSSLNSLNNHLDKFSRLNCEPWVIQANAAKGLLGSIAPNANKRVCRKEAIVSSGRNVDE
jgi:hypothetical protein